MIRNVFGIVMVLACVLAPGAGTAQSEAVRLRFTIPVVLHVESIGAAELVETLSGGRQYEVLVRVRANTSYRVKVRLSGAGLGARVVTFDGRLAPAGAEGVVVATGARGGREHAVRIRLPENHSAVPPDGLDLLVTLTPLGTHTAVPAADAAAVGGGG